MDEFEELFDIVPTDGGRGTTLQRSNKKNVEEHRKLSRLYEQLRACRSAAERERIQSQINALEKKLRIS